MSEQEYSNKELKLTAAVITGKPHNPRWVEEDLEAYFVPKSAKPLTREHLERTRRGVAYTKPAMQYLFRRVK